MSVLDDGTVGVRYSDFRASEPARAVEPLATDEIIVHCHPDTPTAYTNPANWGSEVKLTDASYNMRQVPFARGWFVGDYVGVDNDAEDFAAVWTRPFGSDLGTPSSAVSACYSP